LEIFYPNFAIMLWHFATKGASKGATIFSITTLSLMGLYLTFSISDTQKTDTQCK
jgi:hypothetical protein